MSGMTIIGLLRWTARILSVSYLAFFLFMLTAHLLGEPTGHVFTFREGLSFACIGAYFAGCLLGWRKEVLGGALAMAAIVGLVLSLGTTVADLTNPRMLLVLWLGLPACLYLLAGTLGKKKELSSR